MYTICTLYLITIYGYTEIALPGKSQILWLNTYMQLRDQVNKQVTKKNIYISRETLKFTEKNSCILFFEHLDHGWTNSELILMPVDPHFAEN